MIHILFSAYSNLTVFTACYLLIFFFYFWLDFFKLLFFFKLGLHSLLCEVASHGCQTLHRFQLAIMDKLQICSCVALVDDYVSTF